MSEIKAQAVTDSGLDLDVQMAPGVQEQTERAFSISMVISGIRCTLTYVILPFLAPLIGLAPGVGPSIGIVVGTVAIVANIFSLRRVRRSNHRWRKPMTYLHVGMLGLLTVLVVVDIAALAG